jgi:hypothetical protein
MPSKTIIQLRRDTAANWTTTNPVLAAGETGFETDTDLFKIGDGTTTWTSLPYNVVLPTDSRLSDARTPTAHTHDTADVTSGTFAIGRIPTGTTSTTVSLGNHTHSIANVTGLQTALDAKLTTADTGWLTSTVISAATGWSVTSYNIRRLNGIVNGILTVSRSGGNITVPATGNITNQNVATLTSGWYNTTSDSGMVLTNGSGPLTGGYIQSNGTITISAMSSGATISTGDTFSFTLFEMV